MNNQTCNRCNQVIRDGKIPGLVWAWCGCLPMDFKRYFLDSIDRLKSEIKKELASS